MCAETEAFKLIKRRRIGLEAGFSLNNKPGTRRAVKEVRADFDVTRLTTAERRIGVGFNIHTDTLRNKVLNRNTGRADLANTINLDDHAPLTTGSRARQIIIKGHAAKFGFDEGLTCRFHTVRTIDHETTLTVCHCAASVITQHRCRVDHFPRTINAPLCVDEAIHRIVRRSTANTFRREVNRRTIKIEHRKVAGRTERNDHARTQIASTVQERLIKMYSARTVSCFFCENFIVHRDELQADIADLTGGLQRAHDNIKAGLTPIACQSEVGGNDPATGLCRRAFAAEVFARVGQRDEICASFQLANGFSQWEDTGDRLVLARLNIHRAGPDWRFHIVRIFIAVEIAITALRAGIAFHHTLEGERSVINAGYLNPDFIHIHGFDRQAVSINARQDDART